MTIRRPAGMVIQPGTRFGRLVVVSESGIFSPTPSVKGRKYSLCRCDCGKEKVVLNNSLLRNVPLGTRSCGCLGDEARVKSGKTKRRPCKIGERFGRLIVIAEAEPMGPRRDMASLCRCDCGKEKIIRTHSLKLGLSHSCGCLIGDVARSRRLPIEIASTKSIYHYVKANAKSRKHLFELSPEDVAGLVFRECFYCGDKPSNVSRRYGCGVAFNGIDRVNNSKGYVPGNVVPCCRACNISKHARSAEEYIERCKRVVALHGK